MSKYLVQTVETYRVDTEEEVERAIAEAKEDSTFTLVKYNREQKETKAKGEVIDEYYKLTLTKAFTDMKDPAFQTFITYEVE